MSYSWTQNLCPPAELDPIQQVHVFPSSCQMTHRTAELSWAARALIGRRHSPAQQRRERTAHIDHYILETESNSWKTALWL